MTAAEAWQAYADDSADHRNPADADVAEAICTCRHDAELERLHKEQRDLRSQWDRRP